MVEKNINEMKTKSTIDNLRVGEMFLMNEILNLSFECNDGKIETVIAE